jgi:hypothetical protein
MGSLRLTCVPHSELLPAGDSAIPPIKMGDGEAAPAVPEFRHLGSMRAQQLEFLTLMAV